MILSSIFNAMRHKYIVDMSIYSMEGYSYILPMGCVDNETEYLRVTQTQKPLTILSSQITITSIPIGLNVCFKSFREGGQKGQNPSGVRLVKSHKTKILPLSPTTDFHGFLIEKKPKNRDFLRYFLTLVSYGKTGRFIYG